LGGVHGRGLAALRRHEVEAETLAEGHADIAAHGGDIRFDGSAVTDENLPGPADLLAAALAACIVKNIERFAKTPRFEYRQATVDDAVEREGPAARRPHPLHPARRD